MKKLLVLVFVFSLLFLGSCIKVDVSQSVKMNGVSDISLEVDMTEYIKQVKVLAKSYTGSSAGDMSEVDYCSEIQESPVFLTQECYQKNENIFGIIGTVNLIENEWMSVSENAYDIDVRTMVPILLDSDEETFAESYTGTGVDSPQSVGFEYTYTLTLPGIANTLFINGKKISIKGGNASFSFGKVENNVLSFDIFEMLAIESFVIYGEKTKASLIDSSGESIYIFQKLTLKQQSSLSQILMTLKDEKVMKIQSQIEKNISTLQAKKSLTQKELSRLSSFQDIGELVRVRLQ